MKTKLFSAIAKKIKHLTSGLKEKPSVQIDDYVLEHFLLYNGLIGSAPDNQPRSRDLRADIIEAINRDSSSELAVALKVLPLWWEDRLEKVFSEIAAVNKLGAISCLLATNSNDFTNEEARPLRHPDWRVRANAARMLAFLSAYEAVPAITEALNDHNEELKAAFCHLAYALGQLGTEQAKTALAPHLHSEEPWFRVDSANALSCWALPAVANLLAEGILDFHPLQDYMAVAIARKHKPLDLLSYKNSDIQAATCEILLALVTALEGPFQSEFPLQKAISDCLDLVNQIAKENPNPRTLNTAITLNDWANAQEALDHEYKEAAIKDLSNPAHCAIIENRLKNTKYSNPAELGELRHALKLCGKFKLPMSAHLANFFHNDFPLLNELIECAGLVEAAELAVPITTLILERFNLEERSQQPLSSVPIFEADRDSALLYWTALKSLAYLKHTKSIEVLSLAVNDYAPDKREQALLSLQKLCLDSSMKSACQLNLDELITTKLADPSPQVKCAALDGIKEHTLINLLPEVLKLLQSQEISLQKKSQETVIKLAESGQREHIVQLLEQSLGKEHDYTRKERLASLLARLNK